MSVAFRRESDEEHKEPRFELPIPPGPNLVTQRGYALTQARVAELEAAVVGEADPVRGEALKRDLRYWRTRFATARVAPAPPDDEVAFGSRVTIDIGGDIRTVDIVGIDEAEPNRDRLAYSAPLARALIGAEEGDVISFGKTGAIRVVKIERVTS